MAETVIKDFSYTDEFHPFIIGGEEFRALPDIPLSMMAQITRMSNVSETIEKEGPEAIIDLFTELLQTDSAERFKKALVEKRVGVKKITEILPWILEKNGLRPTQPSSNSSDGSDDEVTGSSSTDGALPEALTL